MILAKLTFHMPCNPVARLSKATGHTVKVMRCAPSFGGGGQGLMRVDSDDLSTEEVVRRLEDGDSSFKVTTVSPGRHIVTAEHPSCEACRALMHTRCFLEEGQGDKDGRMTWTVIATDQEELRKLKGELEASGSEVSLESVRHLRSERELTPQQDKVIRLAFDLGYYDIPRKIDLAKLAGMLDISKPTLDIMLRRAQKKILASYLQVDG
ncbi:MAG: helix-turn-helix domain-containing protein [Methanomassiliicoccales archaeon]|nr:MAG: helix-turn-helix domain-containing protein [Methanomassiliicoccales archaeon]